MLINIISIIWSNNKGQLVQQAIDRSTNNCVQAFSNGCQVFLYSKSKSINGQFIVKLRHIKLLANLDMADEVKL